MATRETIRIGVVGAGANTRLRHIPGFQAIEGVEVVAVCNRTEASSRAVAEAFGIPRICGHWREIVEADDVDAVCIGTWPYLHAEITCAALEAGKHVLTEARMARNVAEAERMLEASRKHPELVAQIVPAPMSLDLDAAVSRLFAEGRIGELREVCLTQTGPACADASAPLSWRQDFELSGVNTLMLGIYYEMGRRWTGIDPVRVLAQGRVFTKSRRDGEGREVVVRIPDAVTVLGEYADGGRLVGHFSGVETTRPRTEIRVNGSRGCLRGDFAENALYFAPVGGEEAPVAVPESERRGWRVEADFVESIRTGAPVQLTNFEDGLAYMRFTEAVFRSQEAGGIWVSPRELGGGIDQ
ncbi:MAG: gfo/Idh/MocA family oxidoreductase [Verrucomicrobia bacterium]|nr:MAG: gfo/Idh/MocA family oxidoreductase [Verrucomicrobiota bacterium]